MSSFRYLLVWSLLLLCSQVALAQSTWKIRVIDGDTREPMAGATLEFAAPDNPSYVTDTDGYAEVKESMPSSTTVTVRYIGYTTLVKTVAEIKRASGEIRIVASNVLDSIVVIGRRDDPVQKLGIKVDRVTKEDIAFFQAQTAAELLAQNADVSVQRSQMGGGSPIIRGFEANKILLVVDGVRMNNAIYRSGHLQNSITIDGAILEQAEVLHGPGAMLYGSDALGGVVHYRTRDPKLATNRDYDWNGGAFARYSTANQEKTVHAHLNYGSRRWASLSSVTFSNFDDLRAGDNRPEKYPDLGKRKFYQTRTNGRDEIRENSDPNLQVGTGYSQIDFLQKIKFQPSKHFFALLNVQYSTSSNVPRYDNMTDTTSSASALRFADWYYGPQKRFMASMKLRWSKPTVLYDRLSLIGSYQKIDEDRYTRRFGSQRRTFQEENVWVYSLTLDFDKYLDKNNQLSLAYGIEANHNTVDSKVSTINVDTDLIIPNDGLARYPSGGNEISYGAGYAILKAQTKNEAFHAELGARYTWTRLFSRFLTTDLIAWPSDFYNGITSVNSALTWSGGLFWHSPTQWEARVLVSSAFRAPNLDDFGKMRSQDGFTQAPNTELKPEMSINYDVAFGKLFGAGKPNNFRINLGAYYTDVKDVIVGGLGQLPNGSKTIIVDGELNEVTQNFNALSSYVYGGSAKMDITVFKYFYLKGSVNYTFGRVQYADAGIDTLVPLDHIPPIFGRASIGYQNNKFRIELVNRFNGKKIVEDYAVNSIVTSPDGSRTIRRNGTEDNLERATPEGSLAWQTWNLYTSWQVGKKLAIQVSVENILDTHYRLFASGVSAPGRNFIFTLRSNF